jgi:hypothetical protein
MKVGRFGRISFGYPLYDSIDFFSLTFKEYLIDFD